MNKRIFGLTAFLLIFGVLFSEFSYADSSTTGDGSSGDGSISDGSSFSGFDVSIDRVKVNDRVVAQSRTNLVDDADEFEVLVDFTTIKPLENGHVEVILRGRQSSDVVSDATETFSLDENEISSVSLTLVLIDRLKRETEYDLTVKIADARGHSEQKTYGLKTKSSVARAGLDVSIDRVKVNEKVVAQSRTNFIEESNDFDIVVEFTTLEDLEDAHVEAILKDLDSGLVLADSSPNFDLEQDESSSELLTLELFDQLKQSDSFELTVKIVDAERGSIQQIYGLSMEDGIVNGGLTRILDISIDSVEVESDVIAENENNFVVIDESNDELDLKVRLTSLESISNAHVDAVLSFENGDVVADATTTFDIEEGESVLKKLNLHLIGEFEQNNFKLKVRVVDADGEFEEKLYGLTISRKEFPFIVSSIILSPEDNAEAGKSIVASLSIKNVGVVPLEGIKAQVSISGVGVSSTRFLDISKSSNQEIKEDFVLKIGDDIQTGTYTLRAEISSQFGSESEVKEVPVFILGTSDQNIQVVNDKLVINIPVLKQNIKNDGSEVIYQLVLTNQGPDTNTYTLLLDGASWANLRLSGSNVFVIKPKESRTVNIYASTTTKAAGEQVFVATIMSDDNVLKQIPFKGHINSVQKSFIVILKDALKMLLIAIAVFFVALGLFLGIKSYMQGNNSDIAEEIPDQEEGEAYY